MNLDALTLHAAFGAPSVTALEARSIARLAHLVSAADVRESLEECDVRDRLVRHVYALAGLHSGAVKWPVPMPLPDDREERLRLLNELSRELSSRPARELAYTVAYLIAVADGDLARIESTLLAELQLYLDIADARAAELVATASERVTPMA